MINKLVSKLDFENYEDYYSNFNIKVPENFNFAFDIVDAMAEKKPDKTAMVWCNDKGDEKNISFGEMKYYSNKAANLLKTLGIKKGDRIMLILKRRFEFWYTLLAIHKLGAIAIPATHLLTSKDIIYRCNAAGIKMIISVAEDEVVSHINGSKSGSPTLETFVAVNGRADGWYNFDEELEKASADFTRPDGDEGTKNGDTMLLYFTSGTTGMPKMVLHDFTYPLGHINTAKYWQCVQDDGLHLTVSDTGWMKSMWGKIYGQWICGSAVFTYDHEKFNAREMLEVIVKYKVTTFCAPPTIYRFLIKEDLTQYDLSSLTHCSIAGEPLNPEVYNQFYKATGLKLAEGYGQTELTLAVANFPWMEPKPGSMGKPAPGYDADIVDEEGNSCEVGEEGQIVIRTNRRTPLGMFCGYFKDEDLKKEVWHDDMYFTGDMAWRDEDGYFWFVGRADDVIKSSGYRIGPFEVESALIEHPAVLECAITAVPDPDRGQIVKASVILAKGYVGSDALVKELQDHVKRVTAPYKYPRVIEFVTELPKTISGKIRRVEIRQTDMEKK
ncbi:MAG: AMP-binding protein [Clostridiaceae bacterium]|nr:AMP-binding protein [Clostridiaceae bacterium]